jgi:hypothetical protein
MLEFSIRIFYFSTFGHEQKFLGISKFLKRCIDDEIVSSMHKQLQIQRVEELHHNCSI